MNNVVPIKSILSEQEPRGPYAETDERNFKEYGIFQRICTDSIMESVGVACDREGAPYINPDFYYATIRMGMRDLHEATPEFVMTQIERATAIDPNNQEAPYKIYLNLCGSYRNRLLALNRIKSRKATATELPEIDDEKLALANNAYAVLEESIKNEMDFLGIKSNTVSKEMVGHLVAKTRESVLKPIEDAAEPVIEAGEHVLDLVFKHAGVNRKTLEFEVNNRMISDN